MARSRCHAGPVGRCAFVLLVAGVFGLPGSLLPSRVLRAQDEDGPGVRDSLRVKGETHEGTLLDITDAEVVLETSEGKLFFPRSDVRDIQRGADADALAKYERYFEKFAADSKADSWRNLARFARKESLHPEFRRALRKLLIHEPDNAGAHKGLGKALLDGQWLSEREVEEKVRAGFEIVDGALVRKKSKTAVREPGALPEGLRMVARKELDEKEKAALEADRARAEQIGEAFRKKLREERRAGSWHEVKSDNFLTMCNSTKELAQRYSQMMELIRFKLSRMFKSKVLKRLRAPVKIYANQEAFIEDDFYAGWAGRGLGGYYMPSNQMIVTYHGTFGFTGTTFGVLAHEGTHYYQGLVLKGGFDNLPIWLIEGLAVYFGDGSRFDPDQRKPEKMIEVGLIPRDRLTHLQEKMEKNRHSRIEKLVAMTRQGGFSGSHYADAWGLIYFLVNSGSQGTKLMQHYWSIGLEEKLTPEIFQTLAEKYYGTLDKMNEEYVKYTLALKPPPAGEVVGDYFISNDFQIELQAPDSSWQFFEDDKDKKLLIGLLQPGSTGQIRLYYENNMYGVAGADFIDKWKDRADFEYENVQYEKHRIAGHDGFRVTYIDTRRENTSPLVVELDDDGDIVIKKPKDDDEEKEPEKPRRCVRYFLIQEDGIASIECSSEGPEYSKFGAVFDEVDDRFRLITSRRW